MRTATSWRPSSRAPPAPARGRAISTMPRSKPSTAPAGRTTSRWASALRARRRCTLPPASS
eukprot:7228266-Prymnesium_polylepis.1